MYELIQLNEKDFYIQSPAKVGLVRLDNSRVLFIDSGSDKDAGRKLRQILDKNGWTLTAIYSTHSNADHIGGNKYLQAQTGCKIYASGAEQAFSLRPELEPAFLYGGYPPKDLRHKFLMASESDVLPLTKDSLPEGLELIPLPGHFFDMVGYRSADGTAYIADCLSSRETLVKYGISFIYDVGQYISTLERLMQLDANIFVPAHAEPAADIKELAQYNIDKVYEIAEAILTLCREPLSPESLLQALFGKYSLSMNFEQYVLVGSTVRSYLAWLRDAGRIEPIFENNLLLWHTI